jgi:hypothetical protein
MKASAYMPSTQTLTKQSSTIFMAKYSKTFSILRTWRNR